MPIECFSYIVKSSGRELISSVSIMEQIWQMLPSFIVFNFGLSCEFIDGMPVLTADYCTRIDAVDRTRSQSAYITVC